MSATTDRETAANVLCNVLGPRHTSGDADEILDALNRFAEAVVRADRMQRAHQLTPHPDGPR